MAAAEDVSYQDPQGQANTDAWILAPLGTFLQHQSKWSYPLQVLLRASPVVWNVVDIYSLGASNEMDVEWTPVFMSYFKCTRGILLELVIELVKSRNAPS